MIVRLVCGLVVGALIAAGGEFERRFELTLERVVRGGPPAYTPPLLLADVEPRPGRRFTEFSGDLSGRYLGALAAAAALRPAALDAARSLAPRIIELQRGDGRFGDPLSSAGAQDDDMARLWGQGRLLVGLLEYHEATGDPASLEAARRLGDFLASVAPRFNSDDVRASFSSGKMAHGYICWTQNIEGLAELYRVTSDERYAELARELAGRIERRPGQHSHGLLTSLRGLLALAEATGEQRFAEQAAREWRSVAESRNLLPTASMPEYFTPGIRRDEGCSQADWVRLSLELWRRTGERRYLDMGERALFNAFYMNQMATGDFGHVTFAESGPNISGLDFGETRAWWCCTLHGLRAFPAIAEHVFRAEPDGLRYDLPVDGVGESAGLRLEADSTFERNGRVGLQVLAAPGEARTVWIRRPSWASEVRIDGAPAEGELALTRVWNPGDRVEIDYRLQRSTAVGPGGSTLYFQGPWLMGVAEATAPAYFDEPHLHNRFAGKPEPAPDSSTGLQAAYLPAGYRDQPQQLVLRPVAERGSVGAGLRWVFAFGLEGRAAKLPALAEKARSWALPFGLGLLLGAAVSWLLVRRSRARRPGVDAG